MATNLTSNLFNAKRSYQPISVATAEKTNAPELSKLLTLVNTDGDAVVTPEELEAGLCQVPTSMRGYAGQGQSVVKDAVKLMLEAKGCAPTNDTQCAGALDLTDLTPAYSLGKAVPLNEKRRASIGRLPVELRASAEYAARLAGCAQDAPKRVSVADVLAAEVAIADDPAKANIFAGLVKGPSGKSPVLEAVLANSRQPSSPLPAQRVAVPELGTTSTPLQHGKITLLDPCATAAKDVCFSLASETRLHGQFQLGSAREGKKCRAEASGERTLTLDRTHSVDVDGLPEGWTAVFTPRNNPRAASSGTVNQAGRFTVKIIDDAGRPVAMTQLDVPKGGKVSTDASAMFSHSPETETGVPLHLHFDPMEAGKTRFHYSPEAPPCDEQYNRQLDSLFPQNVGLKPGVYTYEANGMQATLQLWPDRDDPSRVRRVEASFVGNGTTVGAPTDLVPTRAIPYSKQFGEIGWQLPMKGGYQTSFYRDHNKNGERSIRLNATGLYSAKIGADGFFSGGVTTHSSQMFVDCGSVRGFAHDTASCVPVKIDEGCTSQS